MFIHYRVTKIRALDETYQYNPVKITEYLDPKCYEIR